MHTHLFFDRYEAGQRLARKLVAYTNSDSVVLAIPSGGVLVGYEIATHLHLPLDVVITQKISHPLNNEMAICAITENGRRICDNSGLYGHDETWISQKSAIAMGEAVRRRQVFGAGMAIPITNKTVIVTDDGISTGLTMKAVLLMIHAQKPKKIILAVPVCPHEVIKEMCGQVDEIFLLDTGKDYRGAVGAYYTHFPKVSDKEVVACLSSTKKAPRKLFVPTTSTDTHSSKL
jgi:putative phosphoribosyl transferase